MINSTMFHQQPPCQQVFPVTISHSPALHPCFWSRDMVKRWLYWAAWEFSLSDIDPDQFEMNGKALCLLSRQSFTLRALKSGDILFEIVQSLCRRGMAYAPMAVHGGAHYNMIPVINHMKQQQQQQITGPGLDIRPGSLAFDPVVTPRPLCNTTHGYGAVAAEISDRPGGSPCPSSRCRNTGSMFGDNPAPFVSEERRPGETGTVEDDDDDDSEVSGKRKRPEHSPVSRSPQHYKKLRLLPPASTTMTEPTRNHSDGPDVRREHASPDSSFACQQRSLVVHDLEPGLRATSKQIDTEQRHNSKFVRYSPPNLTQPPPRRGPQCAQVPVIVASGGAVPHTGPRGGAYLRAGPPSDGGLTFVTAGHLPPGRTVPVHHDFYSYAVTNGLVCPMPGVPTVLVHAQPTYPSLDNVTPIMDRGLDLHQPRDERCSPPRTPWETRHPQMTMSSPRDAAHIETAPAFSRANDSPYHTKTCLNSSGESDMSSVSSEDDVTSTVDVPANTCQQEKTPPADITPTSKKSRVRMSQVVNEKGTRLLWNFLFSLLNDPTFATVIQWVRPEEHVFRIVDSQTLAKLWGENKQRENMTYEKMARGLRYYYSAGIIQKEPGRRLMYRFVKNPNEIRGRRRGRRPGITVKKVDPITEER